MAAASAVARTPRSTRYASPPLTPTPSPGRRLDGPGTLLEAASLGDEESVSRLLEQDVAPDVADGDGWTALIRAAAAGHEAIVRILLSHGASILPLFVCGQEAAHRQAHRSGRSTPLHYKELFGEVSIVNMLVVAAATALPSADSESTAKLLRGAQYGRVLMYLRALQPLANQKVIDARLAAQSTAAPSAAPHVPVKGTWSVAYDQFVRDAGESVARQVLLRGRPYPERRIVLPAPAPRPSTPPFKQNLPSSLVSTTSLPAHDPVKTGAHWYSSARGPPTELEGVVSVPTQMPELPVESGAEWSTDPHPEQLVVSRHHSDLVVQSSTSERSLATTTTIKRVRDSLWESSRHKELGVAVTSSAMSKGRHYMECRVLASANSGFLVGVAQSDYDPSKAPRFAGSMWAFDALDGSLFHAQRSYRWRGMEPSVQGDCIGIHLDSDRGLLTLYKNGKKLGVMCGGLRGETLSWVVPLWDVGDCVQVSALSKPTIDGQALPLTASAATKEKDNDANLHLNCKESELLRGATTNSQPAAEHSNRSENAGEQEAPSNENPVARELTEVQAQSILDAEAARARPEILEKLRKGNEQTLHTAQKLQIENENFLQTNCRKPLEHKGAETQSAETSATASEGSTTGTTAFQRGYQAEANYQLTRFLKFSEQGAVTLLIPRLSEICQKILGAMTTRQLVNLAERRHVSVLDCSSLTKQELQDLVQKTAAVPEKQLYIDLDSVSKEFRQRLHYHHRSAAVTRPELMIFLKELGADQSQYFDKQKVIQKLTEHWAGKELKRVMLSDKSKPIARTGQELAKDDPAALVLSRTEWVRKLETALGWIAPGMLFVAADSQRTVTAGLPESENSSLTTSELVDGTPNDTMGAPSRSTAPSSHALDDKILTTADSDVAMGSNRVRTYVPLEEDRHTDSASPVSDAPSAVEQQHLAGLERELRSLVTEAKDAAVTANSAAIAIVKRSTSATQATTKHQETKVVSAVPTAASGSMADETSNGTILLTVQRQEQQILKLTQQLEDVRADLEHARHQAALQPQEDAQKDAYQDNSEDDYEPEMPSDSLKEAEFRAAASKNQVSQMERLKHSVNINATDNDGTDHIFSKTALQGFTALHHAVFGEYGPSLDAMVLLLQWGCRTDIEDLAGITARGYAVDPRAASLLDLVTTPYTAQEGDPGFESSSNLSPADTAALISDVWPARLARAEQHAAILEAAAVGNEAALVAILESVKPVQDTVNCVDGFGQTPLCWAAHQGHKGVVQRLLGYKADVGLPILAQESYNPAAAVRGNFLCPRDTPFLNACRQGHSEIARLLSSNGVQRTELQHALVEMKQNTGGGTLAINRWDVFCHWTPQSLNSDVEQMRISKGRKDIKQLLKEMLADIHSADAHTKKQVNNKVNTRLKNPSKSKIARAPGKASCRSRSQSSRRSGSPPMKKKRGSDASPSGLPPAQGAVALASQSGMQAMLLSPTTLDTLSDKRVTELACNYEKRALAAAQAAADGAIAVAAYIKENGTRPPSVIDDLKPKPPDKPQAGSAPRFTKFHRDLRLSSGGQQVEKKRSTTHGSWRTALCAGSKMVMRRGGGGVPEDYFADFVIRPATKSERRLGEAEGRSGLEPHPHHKNHHHHRALPRHITIGVALRSYNPNTPGRGTSTRECWGYCVHSGMCRHAGRTFDWDGRSPAVPGDTLGLHLRLPNEGDGGGTLSIALNGEQLGEMCDVPPGEYVWMVENGDPGESVVVRAGEPRPQSKQLA